MADFKDIRELYYSLFDKHIPCASIDLMSEKKENKLFFYYEDRTLILPDPKNI